MDLSPTNLKRLTAIHIRRYENRIAAGLRGVSAINLPECERYLAIWRSVEAAHYIFNDLSLTAQREIHDAIEDGE